MWSFRYRARCGSNRSSRRRGGEIGRSGGDQLDAGIGPLHQLGAFQRELAVIFGGAVPHLPGPVHLVAEAPVRHLPGLLAAVLFAQRGHHRVPRRVAVFHPLLRVGPRTRAEIRADVRLVAEHFRVIQKLVRAEAVVLDGLPGHLETLRTLVARADAILPVVVGREVAARPAQQRDVQIARGLQTSRR
jgi:hypothetical protein